MLERIEMLVINDEEARLLSGEDNIVQRRARSCSMGPKMLLIKRGEYGVMQFSDSSVFAMPGVSARRGLRSDRRGRLLRRRVSWANWRARAI